MTTKRERALRQVVEEEGLTVTDVTISGGGHFRVRATTPEGANVLLFTGFSPGDSRALLNFRQDIRRAVRKQEGV